MVKINMMTLLSLSTILGISIALKFKPEVIKLIEDRRVDSKKLEEIKDKNFSIDEIDFLVECTNSKSPEYIDNSLIIKGLYRRLNGLKKEELIFEVEQFKDARKFLDEYEAKINELPIGAVEMQNMEYMAQRLQALPEKFPEFIRELEVDTESVLAYAQCFDCSFYIKNEEKHKECVDNRKNLFLKSLDYDSTLDMLEMFSNSIYFDLKMRYLVTYFGAYLRESTDDEFTKVWDDDNKLSEINTLFYKYSEGTIDDKLFEFFIKENENRQDLFKNIGLNLDKAIYLSKKLGSYPPKDLSHPPEDLTIPYEIKVTDPHGKVIEQQKIITDNMGIARVARLVV